MPNDPQFMIVGDSVTVYTSNPGTLISTGASGAVRFGFNQHGWTWSRSMYEGVGAKAMRIGSASYGRFKRDNAYPGPRWYGGSDFWNEIVQTCVDSACADGFDVVLCLDGCSYGAGDERWGEFCAAVARANLKNAEHVILEICNEPNWITISAARYAEVLRTAAAAIRAVSPKLRISGPTINASYTDLAKKFTNELMATPGIEQCFDLGDLHAYYQTPENCYDSDLSAFIARVDTPASAMGRTDLEYIASEQGWADATGLLMQWHLDPNAENRGSTGNTYVQPPEVVADYYSRWIAIARATSKLRLVTFYALMDERPPNTDPGKTNAQGRFGVWNETRSVIKPAGLVCKDLFAHVHAATGAQQYRRMAHATGNRYVRLDLPGTSRLIAWSLVGQRDDLIAVNAPQGCTLSVNVAGAAGSTYRLTPGVSMVPVRLGQRSVVLSADVPITFPEFVS